MGLILIVEDETLLNDTISALLGFYDFDTISAYDGASAIKLAKEKSPDLILLDMILSDMYGYDVAKEIRDFSEVPIIFLTSMEEDDIKEKALQCRGSYYMSKSVDITLLIEKIKEVLEK